MGVYSEYLDKQFGFSELSDERKNQLKRISEIRGREVLVCASDLNNMKAPITINYSDLLPVKDQLDNLKGDTLDLILETPGGSGEVAEDIVRLIRKRFSFLAVIIPGYAKSAGTLIAMAGDEILMGASSGLGPIDAQMNWQGKVFSADALIQGMEKIKREVEDAGHLNKAYIPILQGISPGELQHAENALAFSKELVKNWLAKYKFKDWSKHSSTNEPVTDDEKEERADEIAAQLCDHGHWLTHARSIKMDDFEDMSLRITDYSKNPDLSDAIHRYHTLLQMTFDNSNIYKLFETTDSQIYRFLTPAAPSPAKKPDNVDSAIINVECNKCKAVSKVQANLGQAKPLEEGHLPFPSDNKFHCLQCNAEIDLSGLRRQLEAQSKKKVVT